MSTIRNADGEGWGFLKRDYTGPEEFHAYLRLL